MHLALLSHCWLLIWLIVLSLLSTHHLLVLGRDARQIVSNIDNFLLESKHRSANKSTAILIASVTSKMRAALNAAHWAQSTRARRQTDSSPDYVDATGADNSDYVLSKEQLDELRDKFELLSPMRTERISYAIAYGVIVVLSLFGNLLVCKVCLKNMTETNALIMSLAASDLLMTVFSIPLNFFRLLNYSWPFGSVMCFLVNFVQHLVVYVSSYTMAIIAIQRYRSLCGLQLEPSAKHASRVSVDSVECQLTTNRVATWCKVTVAKLATRCGKGHLDWLCARVPNKKRKLFSKRAICSSIALTWVLSSLISVLFTYTSIVVAKQDVFSMMYNFYHSSLASNSTPHTGSDGGEHSMHIVLRCQNPVPDGVDHFLEHYSELAKSVLVFLSQYFIPLSISCCLYVRIGKIITRQGKIAILRGNPKARIRQKKKRRRILMLVLVVAVFALTWAPIHAFHLLTDAGIFNYNYQIFMMVHWLAMSSVSYNPFIYCWLNKSFRKAALRVFCCCCVEEEPGSTSADATTLDPSAARPAEQTRAGSSLLDKVTCCARSAAKRDRQNRAPPTTTSSQLPFAGESVPGPQSFLNAHGRMQSNVSVATETSVALASAASMERLADSDIDSEQVQIISPNKCSGGFGLFRRSKCSTIVSTAIRRNSPCQINIQDCSDTCASSSELPFADNGRDLTALCFEQTLSRTDWPDDEEDEEILNEARRIVPCPSHKVPIELRPITRSAALFGRMATCKTLCEKGEHHDQTINLESNVHRTSRSTAPNRNLVLTTDL